MSDKTKRWIKAAGIRALRTFCQTAVALIPVGVMVTEVDWAMVGGVALLAGILSILTSLAGLPEVEDEAKDETEVAA